MTHFFEPYYNFIFGKIWRYGVVGFLVAFALIQAGLFISYMLIRHFIFNIPIPGSEPQSLDKL